MPNFSKFPDFPSYFSKLFLMDQGSYLAYEPKMKLIGNWKSDISDKIL